MKALVEGGPADPEHAHALLWAERLAIVRFEQEPVGAGELIKSGEQASEKTSGR